MLCRFCQAEQDTSAFYESNPTKCKACVRAAVAVRRVLKLDEVRRYDRLRAKLPHRKAAAKRTLRQWRKNNPDKVAAQSARYPDRKKATVALNNAVRDGRVVKPTRCERCGEEKRLEGHHRDYSKPLEVEWLCKTPCHARADAERRSQEAT